MKQIEVPQLAKYRKEISDLSCIMFGLRNKPHRVPKVDINTQW